MKQQGIYLPAGRKGQAGKENRMMAASDVGFLFIADAKVDHFVGMIGWTQGDGKRGTHTS